MGEYFRIESPEDLLEYKRIVENTKSAELPDARLMNDIDMTGVDWEPIVMNKILLNPFDNFAPFNDMQRSVFDGDGHTIKGLETNSAKKIMTNIELKTLPCYYNQLEEKVIALVEKFSLNDRIIYSSFNPLSAVHLKNISPESEIALLLDAFLPENYSYILSKTGFSFFHPSISLISEKLINEMHERSIGVNVWTVDGEENIGRCISLGVDGIISNDVVSSRAILASHEKNTEK